MLLPLRVSFVSLSSDSPTPFQNLTCSHLLLKKKSHSATAEATLPLPVVPEKMHSKGWTLLKVIHLHSETEGCRKDLWEWLAFRPCIQKVRRKTLLAAFPPSCSTGSRAKKQITSCMNKQGSGPHRASQRYSQLLIHSLLAQGLWPS